jgi:drug/metabolite transporter superfamily protein YnfA
LSKEIFSQTVVLAVTEKCYVFVWPSIIKCASKGREGAVHYFSGLFLLFELQWVMLQLQWDPDRYDYISIHCFFLATWSIWDLSEHGEFVEVRCFSFLAAVDVQHVCWTCYGIYLVGQDILLRLDESRRQFTDS